MLPLKAVPAGNNILKIILDMKKCPFMHRLI